MDVIRELENQPATVELVDTYSGFASTGDALRYPGLRPETSYLSDGQNVYPMAVDLSDEATFYAKTTDGVVAVDSLLEAADTDPMLERIPVMAYGANVCPSSLRKKFTTASEDEPEQRPDLQIIPTLYGMLTDYDVVWSDRPARNGGFVAMLAKTPETAGSQITVGVNFLTREQLLIMHATEAVYELGGFAPVTVGEQALPAYFYMGNQSILLRDGLPIALSAVKAHTRNLPEATATEVLSYVLSLPAVAEALTKAVPHFKQQPVTTAEYVAEAVARPSISEKEALRDIVSEALGSIGAQATVRLHDIPELAVKSRSLPTQLPNLGDLLRGETDNKTDGLRLPSQEAASLPPAKRDKVLSAVRVHWHKNHEIA